MCNVFRVILYVGCGDLFAKCQARDHIWPHTHKFQYAQNALLQVFSFYVLNILIMLFLTTL